MTILKILFLLLIIIPFALFLIFILDRLMDEMPSKAEMEAEMTAVERRRKRAAARKGRGPVHRQKATNPASKRKRRKQRKQQKKQQNKTKR